MSEPIPPLASSTTEYYRPIPVWAPPVPKQRYWLHALLLLTTCFTTLVVGARMEFNYLQNLPLFTAGDEWLPMFAVRWIIERPANLFLGVPFSAMLLLVLMAHEMGHYLFCRHY